MCACYNMTISMQGHSQKPLYMGGGSKFRGFGGNVLPRLKREITAIGIGNPVSSEYSHRFCENLTGYFGSGCRYTSKNVR